jgi:hypothetical protein
MSDDLEKFLAARSAKKLEQEQQHERQREHEAQKLSLFAASGKTEWQRLQEDLKTLVEGKSVDAQSFQWHGNPNSSSLILGRVAATFSCNGESNGVIHGCRVVFGRKGDYQQYADDPPLEPIVWHLDFATDTDGRKIMWMIDERPDTASNSRDLASAISKQLVQYHDNYEQALAQWSPFGSSNF